MKRYLYIGLAIFGVIALGVAIYFIFFAPKNSGIVVGDPTNPFDTAGDYVDGSGDVPDLGVPRDGAGEEVVPRLVKIVAGPVAFGTTALTVETRTPVTIGTTTSQVVRFDAEVRYVERASGNVYAYRSEAKTLTRLTNQTLPGVEEAVWAPNGEQVYLRFLTREQDTAETISTYTLPIGREGGYFLEPGLSALVTTAQSVLVLKPGTSGSVGTLAGLDGSGARTLFSSALSALRLYSGSTVFAAHTKASALLDGYGFLINGTTGAFERIVGPRRGLTLLPSPTGAKVLYGSVSGTKLETVLLDSTTRETISLPLGALPEKCVWGATEAAIYCAVPRAITGTIPDDWYQGAVSFSDRLWRIDLAERLAVLLFDPALVADVEIDGVNLSIDPRSDVLFFTNRKDGSLWAYDL